MKTKFLTLVLISFVILTGCKKEDPQDNQPKIVNTNPSLTIVVVGNPVVHANEFHYKISITNTVGDKEKKIGQLYSKTPTIDRTKMFPISTFDSTYNFGIGGKEGTKYYVQAYVIYEGDTAFTDVFEVRLYGYTGEAGGKVIYDKGSYSDGWRYIEVAPTKTTLSYVWGGYDTLTGLTFNKEIGGGYYNTQMLRTVNLNQGSKQTIIMGVDSFSFGGYHDWYVPNINEVNLASQNCITNVKGDVWTSEEYNKTESYTHDPYTHETHTISKNNFNPLWLMRRY